MAARRSGTWPLHSCIRCSRALRQIKQRNTARLLSSKTNEGPDSEVNTKENKRDEKHENDEAELGPLAQKLQEATEEVLLTGGRSGRRAIEDSGFSEDLKEKLFNKIADESFSQQYTAFLAEAKSSTGSVGAGIPPSQPWTGEESTADAVLRMLDDAKKPLKPELRSKFQPPVVDTRLKRAPKQSPGQKAAGARDKAAVYSGMGMKSQTGLTEEEREEIKRGFRERFESHARAVPATVSGIAALANERIENAIARGQFKDIPRGKEVKRDPRADNPFVDTTEYIMNKMIKRQDLVPPWIEKQQDLTRAANTFRGRLRNDWKRHAARTIASKGGSLQDQMRRAEQYAIAEEIHNPRQRSAEQISVPSSVTSDPVMANRERLDEMAAQTGSTGEISVSRPFRDPEWEKVEETYMKLSIDNLNKMTRSYNLMAPDLAKKPYFSLEKELASCYSAIAPLLAKEIQQRATRPASNSLGVGTTTGASAILEQFSGKDNVQVHLEADEKSYGLKQWWRDVWKK